MWNCFSCFFNLVLFLTGYDQLFDLYSEKRNKHDEITKNKCSCQKLCTCGFYPPLFITFYDCLYHFFPGVGRLIEISERPSCQTSDLIISKAVRSVKCKSDQYHKISFLNEVIAMCSDQYQSGDQLSQHFMSYNLIPIVDVFDVRVYYLVAALTKYMYIHYNVSYVWKNYIIQF